MNRECGNEQRLLCQVCKTREGRYKCPRCSVLFCSTACYDRHGKDCTQAFYEEHVIEELKGRRASPTEVKQMKATLANMTHPEAKGNEYTRPGIDEEPMQELPHNAKRRLKELEKLLEEDRLSLDLLKPEEQRRFLDFVQSLQHFSNDLPQWVPWWHCPLPTLQIEECGQSSVLSSDEVERYKTCDLNAILDFDQYHSVNPSSPHPESSDEANSPDDSEDAEPPKDPEDLEEPKDQKDQKDQKDSIESREQQDWKDVKDPKEGGGKRLDSLKLREAVVRVRTGALPPLRSLYHGTVNAAVKCHIANVLCPFLCYSRFYNGEVNEEAAYLATACCQASDVLCGSKTQATICTAHTALAAAFEGLAAVSPWLLPAQLERFPVLSYKRIVARDLETIWRNKGLLLETLLRLYDLIHKAQTISAQQGKNIEANMSKVKSKLLFFLAYVKDSYTEVAQLLPSITALCTELEAAATKAQLANETKQQAQSLPH